ncbi:MAG TPA: enolase C-terminal domain-like protein [Chloroflexota bacterium]|nr:enolase C-terminal domain-like protein [Chloroflexota bacterium]
MTSTAPIAAPPATAAIAAGAPGDVRIAAVRTRFVRLPLAFSYQGGKSLVGGRPMGAGGPTRSGQFTGSLILFVETDAGPTGLGDVIVKGGDPRAGRAAAHFVDAFIAPALVGQSPFDIEKITDRLWGITTHDSSVFAAGADIALHDLVGKLLGLPLYKLLGGKTRDRVPITWNVPANRDISVMVDQARDAVERGFRHVVKVKTGTPWDVEALVAIQQAIGPEVPLRPDDNGAFLAGDSIKRFRAARDRGAVYETLEQPVPNHDLPGLRRVADALGERVMYHVGYVQPSVASELIRHRYADVVSVPVFRHGLHQAAQMVRAFALVGIGCVMGSGLESSIGATAAIHAATALENYRYPIDTLGAHWFAEDVVKDTSHFGIGYATTPEKPGLGIDLDEAQLDHLSAEP